MNYVFGQTLVLNPKLFPQELKDYLSRGVNDLFCAKSSTLVPQMCHGRSVNDHVGLVLCHCV